MEITKWEYRILNKSYDSSNKELEKLGKEGWEMSGIMGIYIYFKRPCGTVQPKRSDEGGSNYSRW